MVGFEVDRSLLPLGEVIGLDRRTADLADPAALARTVADLKPDVIVNAAAYTNVDAAETDRQTAERVNGDAVAALAEVAARRRALLIHYSTDYVFDGLGDTPWAEDDATRPVNAYGESKRKGELALAASSADWLCIRTSWVYASRGKNFVRTMLRLASERDELRVIDDQHGAPTSARNLADVTAHVVRGALAERRDGRFASALLHYASDGCTTWHGLATETMRIARALHADTPYRAERIVPIGTDDFPTKAKRPGNSRLAMERIRRRYGIEPPDWREALRRCIEELA